MSEPQIVSPEQAQEWLNRGSVFPSDARLILPTIATEPDRIRAAVVKALLPIRRNVEAQAVTAKALGTDDRAWLDLLILIERAENSTDS